MMKKWSCQMLLLGFLLLLPFTAQGNTLYVAEEQMTLTEAIEASMDGDVIVLAAGTYTEPAEEFPLTVTKRVTIRAAEGACPIIESPPFKAALRVEAAGVTLQGLEIRFLRTGIYAIGNDLAMEHCKISLADSVWRTSSCGIWCGGMYRLTMKDCEFVGCGVSLAGPPLSEKSADLPKLTGLFEVGEEAEFFTSHTMENCTVNGKPLFYAACLEAVTAPKEAGEIICCGCGKVQVEGADVSDSSMGMILAYDEAIELTDCKADRCGVFGIYVAKCGGGEMLRCSARETNHGLDIRATNHILLRECAAEECDQGLFFSQVGNSAMVDCTVNGTGQGYFMAGGNGNALVNCVASTCENGVNLQKEGHVLMMGCTVEACTVCGVRLDATPTAFFGNTLKDNWTAVMAYGGTSFDFSENRFEGSGGCSLYLRDVGYSRFFENKFANSEGKSVEAVGTMGGSLWIGNELDKPPDLSSASDIFFSGE